MAKARKKYRKISGKSKMDFLSTHSNSDVEDDVDDKADLFSPPSNSAKKQGSILPLLWMLF